MSAHRDGEPAAAAEPAPVPVAPGELVPVAAAETAPAERHRAELDRDSRVERRLTWRELGCLLFVAVFLLVRRRYLT